MTALAGPSLLGPDGWRVAEEWARSRNDTPWWFIENARRYWTLASVNHAIRPEVAYAQHAKETAWGRFGGVLDASFHNPAGIKIREGGSDYDPLAHERFADWDEGIRAHLNHLDAYARGRQSVPIGDPHGRWFVVITTSWAGTIKEVEQLDARWAPSPTYGRDLVRLYLEPMMALA